jgi:hypothetical protein
MVEILQAIGSPGAAEGLASQAIFDNDSEIRQAALAAIPDGYHRDASRWFASQLSNSKNVIVNRAGVALQHVGSEEVVGELINALVTSHNYTVYIPYRDGVAFNLGGSSSNSSSGGLLPAGTPGTSYCFDLPSAVQINGSNNNNGGKVSWKPVKMRRSIRNEAVLSALESITDENFGYDQRLWQLWLASHKNQGISLSKQRSSG